MNAVLRLENPVEQKPLGNDVVLPYPASAEEVQSWPPLLHSHWILSFLRADIVLVAGS